MNERDELATVIETAYDLNEGAVSFELLAHATLAAGYRKPRTITTVEDLDALPLESVLKASDGNIWESLVGGWFETASRVRNESSSILLPAAVLWEPAA